MPDTFFSSMFVLKTLSIRVADWSENLVGSVILGKKSTGDYMIKEFTKKRIDLHL